MREVYGIEADVLDVTLSDGQARRVLRAANRGQAVVGDAGYSFATPCGTWPAGTCCDADSTWRVWSSK